MNAQSKPSVTRWIIGTTVFVIAIVVVIALRPSRSTSLVCITQVASHPSLDEVRRGVVDSLADHGYHDGKEIKIIFRNANGDPSLTLPIAQDFVKQGATVIVPITTPSAMAAAKTTDRIPIIFGGVTDPKGVGLVSDLQHPSANVTGTSDRWPYEKQVDFFRKLLPELKRIGILHTAGDDVSTIAVKEIKQYGASRGLEVVTQPVSNASDVYPSAAAMLRNVDAIYTGMDNLIADSFDSILKAAREAGKPVLSGDAQSVELGALATWSISMYDLGRRTGDMVAEVLNGKSPSSLPVHVVTEGEPIVNKREAERFNIPDDRLDRLHVRFVNIGEGN